MASKSDMARRQQERERVFKEREKQIMAQKKDAQEREEAHAKSIAGSRHFKGLTNEPGTLCRGLPHLLLVH